MKLFDEYFHGRYRAARVYVFAKVFLCMVALDTWMLMIGHAGRYGVDGFNVAQFTWLDRLEPLPSAGLYVGVLVLTGLCALTLALAGTQPIASFALFLLYTFSWSMSMLDSYQHHYFVSAILFCLVFFPRVRARDVHPLPLMAAGTGDATSKQGKQSKPSKKESREHDAAKEAEKSGLIYALLCWSALFGYAFIPAPEHPWALFFVCIGSVVVATVLYRGAPAGTTGSEPALTSGFGFNLLGAMVGVLYTYTSIAKMDAQWCAGNTLQRISSAPKVFAPLVDFVVSLGLPRERFWSLFASSVIPIELAVALGYLLAVRQDVSPRRGLRVACTCAFGFAMTVHIGAEAMGLEIGWFSYYMMLLACAYLLPGQAVDRLATLITWPARFFATQLELEQAPTQQGARQTFGMALGTALVLAAVGHMLDLPGAQAACVIAAGALIALALFATARKQLAELRSAVISSAVAAALMWAAIAVSPVRWDFYRYLGGDLRRRHQPEAALTAYEKGERYAPKGDSRQDKINELKLQLGR